MDRVLPPQSTVRHAPTVDLGVANKKYVDDEVAAVQSDADDNATDIAALQSRHHIISIDSTTLTDEAAPGTTLTQWGTEEVTFDDPGVAVTVEADLHGYGNISDGVNTIPQVLLQVSFDGGSNWTSGPATFSSLHRNGSGLRLQRAVLAAALQESATPTGEIQVRAQCRDLVAISGGTTFSEGFIRARVYT